MRFLFKIIAVVFLFLSQLTAAAAPLPDADEAAWRSELVRRLDHLCAAPLFETSQLALCVYDLTADTLLYARHERQLMRPASTMKLLTAITGLSVLGDTYTYQTKLCHTGFVHNHVLQGDLYVIGGFDPCIDHDDLLAFTDALRAQGIDSIAGMLYGDISLKDTLRWGEGWCWDDESESLTPLLYKEKDEFMPQFCRILAEQGIALRASVPLYAYADCPFDAQYITHRSHSIHQILRPMMKESDNLYAESLFYQLSAHGSTPPQLLPYATARDAKRPIEQLIESLGYDSQAYRIADGSGLSLYTYLSAQLEVSFLRYAYQHPSVFQSLYTSLPIAGYDGTLKNRMRGGSAHKNVRAKTGSVRSVSTLAGYATAANGHQLAFCIFNQGLLQLKAGRDFQDSVCEALCR